MRRTVYLARHGETAWNREGRWQGHTDVVLNEAGQEQARRLAERLRGAGVVEVRASDLARAWQSAEIVAAALGVAAVIRDPDLRERGFGCFEGLTREECEARFPDEWTRYRGDVRLGPPGGEPQQAVVARMRAGVLRAAQAVPPGGASLIVSHGGAMRALIASISGQAPPPLENGATFRLEVEGDAFATVAPLG
jgi:broad specificity phosphatase PhoE